MMSVREQCQLEAVHQRLYCYLLSYCVLFFQELSLRGKCTCPPGSACYDRMSCDSSHVLTDDHGTGNIEVNYGHEAPKIENKNAQLLRDARFEISKRAETPLLIALDL
jgi:hypothetical protein